MMQAQPFPHLSVKFPEVLGRQEAEEIRSLEALCFERDHVSLKLELGFKLSFAQAMPGGKGEINDFLYYSGGKLISYLGICAFGGDAELNGMTHPDYRGRGAFGRLFALAMGELRRRGINSILLLCDRSSQEGLQFVRKAGGVVHHSELEMILKPGAAMRVGDCGVTLREQSCGDETYLAQAQGKTVGKVRLELFEGCGGIYGLVVQPEYRGKGYGKGILMRAVEKLREKGAQSIRLQVDESNGPARHIYEKGGFEPAYVMDYFQLNI